MQHKDYLVAFLFLLFLGGCQCVPSIDTPKEVNPTFYSHILFVNAHPDIDEINILIGNNALVKSLFYNSDPKDYYNVSPGSQNIQITGYNDSTLFNSTINLVDKQNYTLIAYGTDSRVQVKILNDTISNYSSNNAYYRFVDMTPDAPILIPSITGLLPENTLSYRFYTPFKAIVGDKYDIQLKVLTQSLTDSVVLSSNNINFSAGSIYSIVVTGYYNGFGNKKLQLHIVESHYNQ